MELDASCSLVFCGKSSVETEIATRLKKDNLLKLSDDTQVSLLLQSEAGAEALLLKDDSSFDLSFFMDSITTHRFGRFLIWSPRLSSTHDVVFHNFCELPFGTVCVTDVQFKGRGRSKNVWESPKGCLMYSLTLEIEDGRTMPLIQYVVGLAVTEAVKSVCDKKGLPYIDVKIKWPNDIYLNGLKIGGILCTSTYRSKKFNVSASVGLNVDNEQPTTCLNAAVKDLSPTSDLFKREEILGAFFDKFETFFDLLMHRDESAGNCRFSSKVTKESHAPEVLEDKNVLKTDEADSQLLKVSEVKSSEDLEIKVPEVFEAKTLGKSNVKVESEVKTDQEASVNIVEETEFLDAQEKIDKAEAQILLRTLKWQKIKRLAVSAERYEYLWRVVVVVRQSDQCLAHC
ncbi:hypothetical protein Bca52824_091134 [Brassica carinata]|uniref:BPL/LPL catalytic domain-containing protein n=1 Tax=Brassica carinata TaxID=52824 RepID=A0A8X7TFR2_BRACI|nr:hypothetical protein Bca52824_091134 [Brassica carinata]